MLKSYLNEAFADNLKSGRRKGLESGALSGVWPAVISFSGRPWVLPQLKWLWSLPSLQYLVVVAFVFLFIPTFSSEPAVFCATTVLFLNIIVILYINKSCADYDFFFSSIIVCWQREAHADWARLQMPCEICSRTRRPLWPSARKASSSLTKVLLLTSILLLSPSTKLSERLSFRFLCICLSVYKQLPSNT